MNKAFSFLAGTVCGALVGATTILLLTPASGSDLRQGAITHWETALTEARLAMDETTQRLTTEFEMMKRGQMVE